VVGVSGAGDPVTLGLRVPGFGGNTGVDADFTKVVGVAGGVALTRVSWSSNFSRFASTPFHIATPSSILLR